MSDKQAEHFTLRNNPPADYDDACARLHVALMTVQFLQEEALYGEAAKAELRKMSMELPRPDPMEVARLRLGSSAPPDDLAKEADMLRTVWAIEGPRK